MSSDGPRLTFIGRDGSYLVRVEGVMRGFVRRVRPYGWIALSFPRALPLGEDHSCYPTRRAAALAVAEAFAA